MCIRDRGRDGCACEMGWGEQQGRAQGEETPTTVRVVVRQWQRRTAAWRARAGPWQQRGAVAEASGGVCARGIDGRPRSVAQAAHGLPIWAPRRRGGASPCSLSRRVRQRAGRGEDGVRAQVGWGVSGAAPRGSRAASGGRQRRSAAAGARAACLNACARREGRVSEGERER